jgi:mRNA interferase MazF
MSAARLSRGDVWLADLNPIRGREQAGTRPVVIVSASFLQRAGLVVVVPFTTRLRGLQLHVPVEPPEGGLRQSSEALPEMERSMSIDRLLERWGRISNETMIQLEERLRLVLELD